jgi:hypothetical protein
MTEYKAVSLDAPVAYCKALVIGLKALAILLLA